MLVNIGTHKPHINGFRLTPEATRQGLGIAPAVPETRQCGTCNLCCKVKSIVELRKPVDLWCGHAKPRRGCTIYADRPQSCRDYVCQWLIDPSIPEDHKPDKCGLVVETHAERNRVLISVDPGRPINTKVLGQWLQQCEELGYICIVIHKGQAKIFGPDEQIEQATSEFEQDNRDMCEKAEKEYGWSGSWESAAK